MAATVAGDITTSVNKSRCAGPISDLLLLDVYDITYSLFTLAVKTHHKGKYHTTESSLTGMNSTEREIRCLLSMTQAAKVKLEFAVFKK